VLVAADLRVVDNIAAIKQFGRRLSRIARRIFVLDHQSRLSTVQAYALGATGVLPAPVDPAQLLAKLADSTFVGASGTKSPNVQEAAAAGAACIASMFSAVLSKTRIDFRDIKGTGRKIADSVAEALRVPACKRRRCCRVVPSSDRGAAARRHRFLSWSAWRVR